jgi:integrase
MASVDDRRWTIRDGEKVRTTYKGDKPWRARWRAYPGAPQQTQHFRRKSDAEAFLTDLEHAKSIGGYVDPRRGRKTFGEWWTEWRKGRVDLRPSTQARDDTYYKNHIHDRFAAVPLGSVDREMLREWVAELNAKGLAPATVHKAVQLVSMTLAAAVEDQRLARNPAERLPLPKIVVEEMRIITPAQAGLLADAIDERYSTWVTTAVLSGLRFGELAALRRGRVDLLRRRIEVAETVVEVRGHHHFGPPKTKAGRRSVPISPALAELLTTYTEGMGERDLLFTAPDGGAIRGSLFRRRTWQQATVATGLGEMVKVEGKPDRYVGLRCHDLRHTAVSLWIAAGASPKEVAVWAGHTSVVTVLDRYGHLLPGQEDRVTSALDAMFAAQPAPETAPVLKLLRTQ